MGNVIKSVDISSYTEMCNDVNKFLEEDARQSEALAESASFNLVYLAKRYDDWFLDPIVGFVLPGFGDILSSITTLPAIYVAMFKVKSIKLTIAIFYVMMLDMLVGFIPFLGDIVDAFHKSNSIACRYIVGYVEDDEETKNEIDKKAFWGVIVLAIIGFILYAFYALIMSIYDWISGLF